MTSLLAPGQQHAGEAHRPSVMARMSAEVIVSSRCVRQLQQLEQQVGALREEPHQRLEQRDQQLHGPHQAHRQALGFVHAQALGEEVGEDQEDRNDGDERGDEGGPLRRFRAEPDSEQAGEVGAERALAHHAAENGDGVQADLHDGEVVARPRLQLQHPLGSRVALVGHLAQAQAARCRQADLGEREEGAGHDQRADDQQALGQRHGVAGMPPWCHAGTRISLPTPLRARMPDGQHRGSLAACRFSISRACRSTTAISAR